MENMIDLFEKKIIVTGASSGIGRQVCISLSRIGARIVLLGRNGIELKNTLDMMDNADKHKCYAYDLENIDGIKELVQNIVAYDNIKLDGLVHCAGMVNIVPIKLINYKIFDSIMRINYYSFIELVKNFSLKKISNAGSIVAISSVAIDEGHACNTLYAASKAALDSSIRVLAQELVDKNIRINSIRPGVVLTKMTMQYDSMSGMSDYLTKQEEKQLLGLVEPNDIANMVCFLLSSASKAITGRHFYVDGGRLS